VRSAVPVMTTHRQPHLPPNTKVVAFSTHFSTRCDWPPFILYAVASLQTHEYSMLLNMFVRSRKGCGTLGGIIRLVVAGAPMQAVRWNYAMMRTPTASFSTSMNIGLLHTPNRTELITVLYVVWILTHMYTCAL
jgi:hypothetical protein